MEAACSSSGVRDAEGKQRKRRMCVCTRIHQNNADRPVDMVQVREFLDTTLMYADSIAIAVGSAPANPSASHELEKQGGGEPSLLHLISQAAREAEEARSSGTCGGRFSKRGEGEEEGEEETNEGKSAGGEVPSVTVFEVTPWGKFTPALNALLAFAARDGADLVMFQSLETTVGKDAVSDMETHMGADDLVVGAALTGHVFQAGQTVELTGVSTPWNTLALWNVAKLAMLGFLGVADGLLPGVPAGVEEVTAIATLQAVLGAEHARAKLVRLPQVQWQTAWKDEGRRKWHESKMASKLERANKQMLALGVAKGVVEHVDCE